MFDSRINGVMLYWIKRAIKSVHLHSNKSTLDALPDFSQAAAGTSLTKKSDGTLAFETVNSSSEQNVFISDTEPAAPNGLWIRTGLPPDGNGVDLILMETTE